MAESRSYLAIFTIVLALVGVGVATVNESWGVTILFFAILFLAGYLVRNRLEAIGAESFALGSIIVWIGFFILSFPLIDFAWGFVDQSYQVILFIFGILLILIGFTTEMFDLNARFLEFIRKVQANFGEILATIRAKILRSIWTALAVIFLILSGLAFFTSILDFIPNPIEIQLGKALIFLLSAVVSILIEFRELITLAVRSIGEFFKIIFIAIWMRLKNLPALVYDSIVFIIDQLRKLLSWIADIIPSVLRNIYVFGFGGAVVFGFTAIIRQDQLLGSGSIILLLISLVNLVGSRREDISQRVAGIQQSTYSRSLRLRNLIRREHTGNCITCGVELESGRQNCINCGTYHPDCMVCRDTIFEGEQTLICPNCDIAGHADHLERWLTIKPTCPNCREEWSE